MQGVKAMTLGALAVRFLVEVIGIGAVAYWGFQSVDNTVGRILLGFGAALAMIVVWALVVAPKATNPLTQTRRDLIGTGLLLIAASALAMAGQPAIALGFATVVVIDWLIIMAIGPEAVEVVRPSRSHVQ
jgi:Protein of unknown function (DUF2568)